VNSRVETQTSRWNVIPVSGLAGLAGAMAGWRAALEEAATERLFLEPEWVVPWFERLGSRPRALLAAEGGRIRAAAILVESRFGVPALGARVLRPPGLGVSDYLDLLLPSDSEAGQSALEALFDWLLQAGGWDLLDLPNLPAESPTAELVAAAANHRGLKTLRFETYGCPFVALQLDWQSYLASRPSKLRYNLRARQRHFAELGQLHYCHYHTPSEIASQLGRAFEVHARRWHGQHTSTTFSSSPAARRFYLEAAGRMAERGWVDLSTLELDGRLLAFCLGFIRDGKYYYYMPGFDPEYARLAPGTALLAHLIETAYAQGLREFDFMLGVEPYKQPWATGQRSTSRMVVAAPGPRGALALSAFALCLRARESARRAPLLQRARRYGLGAARKIHSGQ
jgi:CelD/BcsL family acetyltransferase involved in cellulose biosynthesis